MSSASKSFPESPKSSRFQVIEGTGVGLRAGGLAALFQIALVYVLIEAALWTSTGAVNTLLVLSASLCILWFVGRGPHSLEEMGIAAPTAAGSAWIVFGGILLACAIPPFAAVLGDNLGPTHVLPLPQAGLYAVWALIQQFVLQAFFYLRMESILSRRWAVILTALLFGLAHIPNFVLALASFAAALFFCEMFRRYRNIFPLAAVHAALGLLVAANFSDPVMRHMRVGIAYLQFHT